MVQRAVGIIKLRPDESADAKGVGAARQRSSDLTSNGTIPACRASATMR